VHGDFPAKNTVCTPYIPINVWFWPTQKIRGPIVVSFTNYGLVLFAPVLMRVAFPRHHQQAWMGIPVMMRM